MSSVRLILIRHGETDANMAGCFLGDLDAPLNPNGLTVVQSLAESIAMWNHPDPNTVILSSSLQRARQTADIIAAQFDHPTIHVEPDLREMSFGSWEGKTSKEVATFAAEDLAKWKHRHPASTVGPTNGETLGQVGQRVETILNSLTQRYPGRTLIVVTHVYVIKAALDRALELPDGYHANRLWLDTASVTIMDWSANPAARTVHRVNWTPQIDAGSQKWLQLG
jgi:broad specificity phosphatase PhoE